MIGASRVFLLTYTDIERKDEVYRVASCISYKVDQNSRNFGLVFRKGYW